MRSITTNAHFILANKNLAVNRNY